MTYRGGPLAPGTGGPGPRPGDRALDAPLPGAAGSVFLARRRAEWTALGFGVTPAVAGARNLRVDDGPAWGIYAASPGETVLLRPDGHVATRSADPGAPAGWLAEHLGARVPAALPS